ncbi:MAG: phosphate transport system substrate-binding protein [Chthoniobacter sp.]|jgi:phosphate transport system substrate-binding protein|nr:phosphate transport system substrate-binding protein [Chthoniobacter sp.]
MSVAKSNALKFSAALALLIAFGSAEAEVLRVHSTPALGQILPALTPALRQAGIEVKVAGEGGSSAAIQSLAADETDVALTVRALTGEDRAIAPDKSFVEFQLGAQAVAVIVARDVWESGVRALSREQLRQIYERQATNWKQVGGADRAIKFYNFERGRGVWELFAWWVYGEVRKAPLGNFEIVVTGEDAHNTVEFHGGSVVLAAPRWADAKVAFALALKDGAGEAVELRMENLVNRKYPLARPVYVIFGTKPTGTRLRFLDILQSAEGQELLRKNDLIPLSELK